ncbi:MAG: ABC transporter permease subunit [bacterium]|nr:ABC transporter permease subunit [bacterium]
MNPTLFKATTRANWLIGLIFLAIMMMYLAIIISMFDPESLAGLNAMLETLPRELVAAMGFEMLGAGLTSFLGNYYYGFIAIMFPMIYCIIIANRLVAKHVDSGSMAYLLSTPNSRLTIVATQAIFLLVSVTILFGLVTFAGIAISQAAFPGQLDTGGFLLLNLVTLLTFYAISGICFFFSCVFDDIKYSLAFGAGIPIAFFVLNMLANVSEQYAWIGNFSLFTLLDPIEILAGGSFPVTTMIILTGLAIVMYTGGMISFNRRNLPL